VLEPLQPLQPVSHPRNRRSQINQLSQANLASLNPAPNRCRLHPHSRRAARSRSHNLNGKIVSKTVKNLSRQKQAFIRLLLFYSKV
jgi:hypothetical protein